MAHSIHSDQQLMQLALSLAVRGQGFVEPNPMVGCVIVKSGKIIGQGWHKKFGGPHAEIHALRMAGKAARGATAYVTLEPCDHHGKTPPCTDALIRAGIKHVVIATRDPNPIVAGRGIRRLRQAGIKVEFGLLRKAADELIAPFRRFHIDKRPYVILKWAQSIDGKIATRTGDSKWITSPRSLKAAHELRARVDGIVVGINTVLADDPALTARLFKPRRIATRIILDRALRTPLSCHLVNTANQTPTWIVTDMQGGRRSPGFERRRRALESRGCQVLPSLTRSAGIRSLMPLLKLLRDRGMTNLMVEGGGKVLGAFLEAGLADEARVFVAPRIIGGETAPGPLRHGGPTRMKDLPGMLLAKIETFGEDICYTLRFHA